MAVVKSVGIDDWYDKWAWRLGWDIAPVKLDSTKLLRIEHMSVENIAKAAPERRDFFVVYEEVTYENPSTILGGYKTTRVTKYSQPLTEQSAISFAAIRSGSFIGKYQRIENTQRLRDPQ